MSVGVRYPEVKAGRLPGLDSKLGSCRCFDYRRSVEPGRYSPDGRKGRLVAGEILGRCRHVEYGVEVKPCDGGFDGVARLAAVKVELGEHQVVAYLREIELFVIDYDGCRHTVILVLRNLHGYAQVVGPDAHCQVGRLIGSESATASSCDGLVGIDQSCSHIVAPVERSDGRCALDHLFLYLVGSQAFTPVLRDDERGDAGGLRAGH